MVEAKISAAFELGISTPAASPARNGAELLYYALYTPEQAVFPSEATAEAVRVLRAPLLETLQPPHKDTFIEATYAANSWSVDASRALYPQAYEQVSRLKRAGHTVVLWTAGEDEIQRGKTNTCNFTMPALGPTSHTESLNLSSFIAQEKTNLRAFQLLRSFIKNDALLVVDDRIENLIGGSREQVGFLQVFPDAYAIWVQQGRRAEQTVLEESNGLRPDITDKLGSKIIRSIAKIARLGDEIQSIINASDQRLFTIFIDLDDTLINRDSYVVLRNAAIHAMLRQNKWVA